MFGFFKKQVERAMDSKRRADECLNVWLVITESDKLTSAQNILKISRMMREKYNTSADVQAMLSEYKQDIIRKYRLKDYMHPAFMQVQILMDLFYTDSRIGTHHFEYTMSVFNEIIKPLSANEKLELERNLKKFIQCESFSLAPAAEQKISNETIDRASLKADEQTVRQQVCRKEDEAAPFVIRKREQIDHASGTAIAPGNTLDADTALTDDTALWEQALNELEHHTYQRGLWAQCFAQANGNDQIAKARYLKQRVLDLSAEGNRKIAVPIPENEQDAATRTVESEKQNLGWPDVVTDNFTSIQHVCGGCGASVNLPRYAPRPKREGHNYHPALRTKNYVSAPPIPDLEITRFSDDELEVFLGNRAAWRKGGDRWDAWEIDALIEIGHVCSYGSEASNYNVPPPDDGVTPATTSRKKSHQADISSEELQNVFAAITDALDKADEAAQCAQNNGTPPALLFKIKDFQIELGKAGRSSPIDAELITSLSAMAHDLSTDYDPNDNYDVWAPLYEAAEILQDCL